MRCTECDREFEPAKPWQHFCSPKCRDAWHYRGRKRAAYCEEVEAAEARLANGINGHGARAEKIDLVTLGLASQPKPIARRKIA